MVQTALVREGRCMAEDSHLMQLGAKEVPPDRIRNQGNSRQRRILPRNLVEKG